MYKVLESGWLKHSSLASWAEETLNNPQYVNFTLTHTEAVLDGDYYQMYLFLKRNDSVPYKEIESL